MGAIEQGGFRFDIEYGVSIQKGAIHVYKEGEFIEELTFDFEGEKPDEGKIEDLVNDYVVNHQ
ncbi:DUF5370 family protein [Salinibacillus xinjiangensis]|uniref:YbxH family protein n=1 Tax=Salinibacillus xinjiangensis TaxID=1229268 RepID=A0A6G1X8G0_9BACI|nr:DUF5370 family protein [Salinibacillus xinjiangensis]MRG87291.1 hypothetical protein [Salinibacillus xinjiangensis]